MVWVVVAHGEGHGLALDNVSHVHLTQGSIHVLVRVRRAPPGLCRGAKLEREASVGLQRHVHALVTHRKRGQVGPRLDNPVLLPARSRQVCPVAR